MWATSDEAFFSQLGKEPILVHRDVHACGINRINFRANLEATRLVEEGVGRRHRQGTEVGLGPENGPF